jgi:N-acetylglucosaminyl-diphospho-decaprenol L-rhamnosyltransferase
VSAPWAAVVVNYEAGDALTACVTSLLADDSAGGPPEVVVVDNGSTDGSVARLRADHPDVAVITPGTNAGYAAAANRGIAATTAAVVAVCNPDLVVRPGTGAVMLDAFADPGVGAAGPRVLEPDGTTYPSARRDPGLAVAVGHAVLGRVRPANRWSRAYQGRDADPGVARDVDWVSGAAVWCRRRALAAVGGWDEGYFMYLEDVDLAWRLRRAGWRIRYEPGGVVVHEQGRSTRRHPVRMVVAHHRASLRFCARRWHGVRRLLLVPAAVFLGIRAGAAALGAALGARRRRRGGPPGSR